MFRPELLQELLRENKDFFAHLRSLEEFLNARFVDLEEPVHALMLSVASGEPLLLKGPPGTAKSLLARAFCEAIGVKGKGIDGKDDGYFEYLLTPFTEPGELFGFYNLEKLARKEAMERDEEGMLQKAQVVFLDEVFNASSAILNSLLAVMNEGVFHDRGRRNKVALQCLIGATNRVPETSELRAFYDRFLLRCDIDNVRGTDQELSDDLGTLLDLGWRETYGAPDPPEDFTALLGEAEKFRRHVAELTRHAETPLTLPYNQARQRREWRSFLKDLAGHVVLAREYDLSEVSNRRLVKMSFVMLVERLLRADPEVPEQELTFERQELMLLPRFFLDRAEEDAVRRMERSTQLENPRRS